MTDHIVPPVYHRLWTTTHEPILEIGSGDTISFDLVEAGDGQFSATSTTADIAHFDWDRVYPLAGPIIVADAVPGDVLEIEFLELQNASWGWTAVPPGLGLLTDDFPDPYLYLWDLPRRGAADFLGVAQIPVRPFCGVVGVCPDTVEPVSLVPPGHFGGNLDCRDLTVGTKLYLPVQVPGARLVIGDPHAAQGDGEVCVSAIEASLSGSARVRLHKNRPIRAPRFETVGPLRAGIDDQGYYATMGVAADLMTAAQDAIRAMIDHLTTSYALEPVQAYVLCSVVVDLKISEVVDAPNWVVTAYLPRSVMISSP